jgi:hypothetical protein
MENISIKGHVQIFDENNNLVTEADNMVVASGRLAIRRAFLNGTKYVFTKIALGTNGDITEPSFTNIREGLQREGTFTVDNSSLFEKETDSSDINKPICLSLNFSTATYDEYANVKELGLFIKPEGGTAETEVLFSRVVFAGYPFTKNHSYTMKYSVYF